MFTVLMLTCEKLLRCVLISHLFIQLTNNCIHCLTVKIYFTIDSDIVLQLLIGKNTYHHLLSFQCIYCRKRNKVYVSFTVQKSCYRIFEQAQYVCQIPSPFSTKWKSPGNYLVVVILASTRPKLWVVSDTNRQATRCVSALHQE